MRKDVKLLLTSFWLLGGCANLAANSIPMRALFSLLLVLYLCTCGRAQRMLATDEIGTMAEEIYDTIKDQHPFAFRMEGVKALEAARTQVLREVSSAMTAQDSIAYHDFVRLVSPLQEVTQCGHLILEPYRDSLTDVRLRENYFGLQLFPVNEGEAYVLRKGRRTTTDSLPPGTIIRAINGLQTPTLIDQLSFFNGINDQGNAFASKVLAARVFSLQFQRYYGLQDSLTLLVDKGGQPAYEQTIYPSHRPYKKPKETVGDINKTLRFSLSEDGRAGILSIRSFSVLKFNNGNYYKYIRGVMDSLNTGNIPKLIIDLRGNTGGNSKRINYLYSFLSDKRFQFCQRAEFTGPAKARPGESAKDLKLRERGIFYRKQKKLQKQLTRRLKPRKAKYRYTGKVVVLIDELTFSASGMFARFVQGSGRGILVGATAGASANVTYGASVDNDRNFYGPNDDFRLRINNIALELPYPIPGNVTPDVEVTPTMEGLREGRDEVLEAALSH